MCEVRRVGSSPLSTSITVLRHTSVFKKGTMTLERLRWLHHPQTPRMPSQHHRWGCRSYLPPHVSPHAGAINAARGRDHRDAPKLVEALDQYWNLSHSDVENRIQRLQQLKRPINRLFDQVWPTKIKEWVQLLKVRQMPTLTPWARGMVLHSSACQKSPKPLLTCCAKLNDNSVWQLSPEELKRLVDKDLDALLPTSAKGWLLMQGLEAQT